MFYKCWMMLVRARWFWGVRVGALRRPRWLHDVDLIRELTVLYLLYLLYLLTYGIYTVCSFGPTSAYL